MEIKILGPGCPRCHELDKRTRDVVAELGIEADIEYVQDLARILEYDILTTPGLVIDGEVVASGRTLGTNELTELLTSIRDKDGKGNE